MWLVGTNLQIQEVLAERQKPLLCVYRARFVAPEPEGPDHDPTLIAYT